MAIFSSDLTSYSPEYIKGIADAIRLKNGTDTKYRVSEMAQAIKDIPSGGDEPDYSVFLNYMRNGLNQYFEYDCEKYGLNNLTGFGNQDTKISRFRVINYDDINSVSVFLGGNNITSFSVEGTTAKRGDRIILQNLSKIQQLRFIHKTKVSTYTNGPAAKPELEYIEIVSESNFEIGCTFYSLPKLKTLILNAPTITFIDNNAFTYMGGHPFNNEDLHIYVRDDIRDSFVNVMYERFSSYGTRAKFDNMIRPLSDGIPDPPVPFDS